MERAERVGLGVAAAGHLLLLAILSLNLVSRPPPPPKLAKPMDVQLIDAIGLQSAAPVTTQEAPAPSKAPDAGPPEDAAPAPEPAPPEPAPPEPAPPKPAPPPEPAPPRPAPPKPAPPKPAPPKPAPVPKPAPKPKPVKPTPAPEKPVKPTPAKPAPAKAVPAKAAPAKPAPAKAAPVKPALAKAPSAVSGKAAPAKAAPAKSPAAKPGAGKATRATGGIASDDFLKGITPEKSPGKAQAPRAQAISALAMNGLGAAIRRQVQPCYELGSLDGTAAMQIVTVLRLRFNPDGSVAGTPQVTEQTGVNDGNRSYARQMAELSRRAVLRCAPLKLPSDLYKGGWDDLDIGFKPNQMN